MRRAREVTLGVQQTACHVRESIVSGSWHFYEAGAKREVASMVQRDVILSLVDMGKYPPKTGRLSEKG